MRILPLAILFSATLACAQRAAPVVVPTAMVASSSPSIFTVTSTSVSSFIPRPEGFIPRPEAPASADLPEDPSTLLAQTSSSSAAQTTPAAPGQTTGHPHTPPPEPKRILGIMPNYRAVSAGVIPPPPTSGESFRLAAENSFDYSSYVFTALTSLIAEGNESHPQLGKGIGGFWAYTWRGFIDKTDGNYWVIWALPTVLHEDERYFALGTGSIKKRSLYSVSRVFVTPNYQGRITTNWSEILGRGIAQGISLTYYPTDTRTAGALSQKYAYALLRDAATNAFREFWPDIAAHVLHRHRKPSQV